MKRVFATLVLLLATTGGAVQAVAPANPQAKAILLEIADTGQEPRRPESGWCGEAAIQMALAYYGGYASQQAINRAGKPVHPDLYEEDIPRALTNVGLESSAWNGDGLEAFLKWIRSQLAAGHPVLLGVKIYPDTHPEWAVDHFVLAVGCTSDALTYNTTWGWAETRTFAHLSTKEKGLSFVNRSGAYFGYAITGMKTESAPTVKPTRVTISRDGDKQVKLGINIEKLERGMRYRILKFTDPASTARTGAKAEVLQSFVANGPRATYYETIRMDEARLYRCLPSP